MIAKTFSGAVTGLDALTVEVQCDLSRGLPGFKIVGLPEKEVKESRDRIKSAIANSGFDFPMKKIVANLAPADIKKKGVGLDLPIACTILQSDEQIKGSALDDKLLVGELSLDGELRPVSGVLPTVVAAGEDPNIEEILVPRGNAKEASIVDSVDVYPMSHLREVVNFLNGERRTTTPYSFRHGESEGPRARKYTRDFQDVKGQEGAKRALEIAAAGGHNVLMSGPPGSGKSMLAKRLPTILPPLTFRESVEVTKIYSIIGGLEEDDPLIMRRKVRSPHHTISYAGMVGGGHGNPSPGEISLGHNGVLFLDEFPEFSKQVLETLRQPMEDGLITISRAAGSYTFPANFTLVAAMNPCPCGYLGDPVKTCTCTPSEIRRYRKKISGPLLDRIDIYVEVQRLETDEILNRGEGARSEEIRSRVTLARDQQTARFPVEGFTNSQMTAKQVEQHCQVTGRPRDLLENAITHFGLSARAYHKILKISRTIADLDQSDKISPVHISEAIQYRSTREKFLLEEGV